MQLCYRRAATSTYQLLLITFSLTTLGLHIRTKLQALGSTSVGKFVTHLDVTRGAHPPSACLPIINICMHRFWSPSSLPHGTGMVQPLRDSAQGRYFDGLQNIKERQVSIRKEKYGDCECRQLWNATLQHLEHMKQNTAQERSGRAKLHRIK
ncbi:hypothetical protein E2C01_052313 [Portunus trituberculatus]|uniref:Uncharacterized protein n=1 Tax=Portunus trituberculatus TaxID=210409 RepID=A0A5B7GLL4_PORTR|nr:hypothetical protein [Portunus trituberculatus]